MNIPEKHRLLFRNTYESLRGRIHSNGYRHVDVLPSYLEGRRRAAACGAGVGDLPERT